MVVVVVGFRRRFDNYRIVGAVFNPVRRDGGSFIEEECCTAVDLCVGNIFKSDFGFFLSLSSFFSLSLSLLSDIECYRRNRKQWRVPWIFYKDVTTLKNYWIR